MSVVKLNTTIRAHIRKDMLVHRFQKEVDALAAARAQLALDTYNDVYPVKTRELMASIPRGWLYLATEACARYGYTGASYATIPFDGGFYGTLASLASKDPNPVPSYTIPYKDKHGCWASYDPSHPLAKRHEELTNRTKTLEEQVKLAEKQVDVALKAKTTIKSLIDAWPECEPFARKYDNPDHPLPVVQNSTLNTLLGLPV